MEKTKRRKVIIMGAAGRDFHNFNTVFRDNPYYEVICFTAAQIPDIAGRRYPKELSGPLYPEGVPIKREQDLIQLIKENNVDEVVFAYSDVSNQYVMEKSALVNAAGPDFKLIGSNDTLLKSSKPVIAVCAVRTGCGKSQTSRKIVELLHKKGLKAVAVRHPMPYGDLAKQAVQRFATRADLKKHHCTIEEREEYEPYLENGMTIYAGVDYEKILRQAEKHADIILWDGGNNDFAFFDADLYITVVDPHRPGAEKRYYPGLANTLLADAIIINKEDTAPKENIKQVHDDIREINPRATIIHAHSPIEVENPKLIEGKKVLVIEDGPTLTHGNMTYGAGTVAAQKYKAKEIIDPRPYVVGTIKETFEKYPKIGALLPAMGYSKKQIKDMQETIKKVKCDAIVIGTPIDLGKLIKFSRPSTRVRYHLAEVGEPNLETVLNKFLARTKEKAKKEAEEKKVLKKVRVKREQAVKKKKLKAEAKKEKNKSKKPPTKKKPEKKPNKK
jgi:predicted GTPase